MLERIEGMEVKRYLEGQGIECVILFMLTSWVVRMSSGDIFNISVNKSGELELWREVEET